MPEVEEQCVARGLAPVEYQWPGSAARCEARRGVDTAEPALKAVQFAILLTGLPLLLLQVYAMRVAAAHSRRPGSALLGGLPSLACLSLNVLSSLLWLFGDGHRMGFGTVITAAQACATFATYAGMRLFLEKMLRLHRGKLSKQSLGPLLVTVPLAEHVSNVLVLASLLAATLPFAASLRAWLAAYALINIVALAILLFEVRMMLRDLYEFRRLTKELPGSQQDPKLIGLLNHVIRSLTMLLRATSVSYTIFIFFDGLGALTPIVYESCRIYLPCALLTSNFLMSYSAVASIRKQRIKKDGATSSSHNASGKLSSGVDHRAPPSKWASAARPATSSATSVVHPARSPAHDVQASSQLTPADSPFS
jgi:hypothetical protein